MLLMHFCFPQMKIIVATVTKIVPKQVILQTVVTQMKCSMLKKIFTKSTIYFIYFLKL